MTKLPIAKIACVVFAFCFAAAIAASAQTFTTLLSFNGTDGSQPLLGSPVQGIDGNLYGITDEGGSYGCGTVFKITPSGTLTTLYSFCSQASCADGKQPYAGLVQATDGNFYGTTGFGGASMDGECKLLKAFFKC